jgi:hypothetical protein
VSVVKSGVALCDQAIRLLTMTWTGETARIAAASSPTVQSDRHQAPLRAGGARVNAETSPASSSVVRIVSTPAVATTYRGSTGSGPKSARAPART